MDRSWREGSLYHCRLFLLPLRLLWQAPPLAMLMFLVLAKKPTRRRSPRLSSLMASMLSSPDFVHVLPRIFRHLTIKMYDRSTADYESTQNKSIRDTASFTDGTPYSALTSLQRIHYLNLYMFWISVETCSLIHAAQNATAANATPLTQPPPPSGNSRRLNHDSVTCSIYLPPSSLNLFATKFCDHHRTTNPQSHPAFPAEMEL